MERFETLDTLRTVNTRASRQPGEDPEDASRGAENKNQHGRSRFQVKAVKADVPRFCGPFPVFQPCGNEPFPLPGYRLARYAPVHMFSWKPDRATRFCDSVGDATPLSWAEGIRCDT